MTSQMITWKEAFLASSYENKDEGYENGFGNGWLDYATGHNSLISLFSIIPNYSSGYMDGRQARCREEIMRGDDMKRSKWYRIRKLACARPNCKVVVTESDTEPRLVGEGSHYKTKGGRYIAHPNAYSKVGWSNMTYYPSTLRVEVGDEWLAKNLTKEEAVAFALDRLTS